LSAATCRSGLPLGRSVVWRPTGASPGLGPLADYLGGRCCRWGPKLAYAHGTSHPFAVQQRSEGSEPRGSVSRHGCVSRPCCSSFPPQPVTAAAVSNSSFVTAGKSLQPRPSCGRSFSSPRTRFGHLGASLLPAPVKRGPASLLAVSGSREKGAGLRRCP